MRRRHRALSKSGDTLFFPAIKYTFRWPKRVELVRFPMPSMLRISPVFSAMALAESRYTSAVMAAAMAACRSLLRLW